MSSSFDYSKLIDNSNNFIVSIIVSAKIEMNLKIRYSLDSDFNGKL